MNEFGPQLWEVSPKTQPEGVKSLAEPPAYRSRFILLSVSIALSLISIAAGGPSQRLSVSPQTPEPTAPKAATLTNTRTPEPTATRRAGAASQSTTGPTPSPTRNCDGLRAPWYSYVDPNTGKTIYNPCNPPTPTPTATAEIPRAEIYWNNPFTGAREPLL